MLDIRCLPYLLSYYFQEEDDSVFEHEASELWDEWELNKKNKDGVVLSKRQISVFALSCSLLFALAYCLSLVIAYLHLRAHVS